MGCQSRMRSSTSQSFELGMPQGASHKHLGMMKSSSTDDICVWVSSQEQMQRYHDQLTRADERVLVISTEKLMALNLPTFHIWYQELDMCHKYKSLGMNVNDADLIFSWD